MTYLSYMLYVGVAVLAAWFGKLGIMLLCADKDEARKNAERTPHLSDAVMGRARINDDWLPDARVQGGMVYNEREKRIEVCGKVSDHSLDRAFRP